MGGNIKMDIMEMGLKMEGGWNCSSHKSSFGKNQYTVGTLPRHFSYIPINILVHHNVRHAFKITFLYKWDIPPKIVNDVLFEIRVQQENVNYLYSGF
jgi:hypothetical protein